MKRLKARDAKHQGKWQGREWTKGKATKRNKGQDQEGKYQNVPWYSSFLPYLSEKILQLYCSSDYRGQELSFICCQSLIENRKFVGSADGWRHVCVSAGGKYTSICQFVHLRCTVCQIEVSLPRVQERVVIYQPTQCISDFWLKTGSI